jgi:signal transduction histidine kinase
MLSDFLIANRVELIDRCRAKVALRAAPHKKSEELGHGVAQFLDQLVKTLNVEQGDDPLSSRKVSGPAGGGKPTLSEIGASAALHGSELQQHGYTLEQVVHDYGDLCQAITDLAFERSESIAIDEFRILNRCLDNAIAEAVTEFAYRRDAFIADKHDQALNERLGMLAHELRNHTHTATLALAVLKTGNVGMTGATAAVLDRSLIALRSLIDSALADVRLRVGMPPRHRLLSLANFVDELKVSSALEAQSYECELTVAAVDPELAVDVDHDLLFSAVNNLLQNAFKFTQQGSEVSLNAYAAADRVVIDVEDQCGGLALGAAETMFEPFAQAGDAVSGVGLGLSICRRAVESNDGILSVRDLPGRGCIFTIDLPRRAIPASHFE